MSLRPCQGRHIPLESVRGNPARPYIRRIGGQTMRAQRSKGCARVLIEWIRFVRGELLRHKSEKRQNAGWRDEELLQGQFQETSPAPGRRRAKRDSFQAGNRALATRL